jgi:predicted nucleic acid-binding protein
VIISQDASDDKFIALTMDSEASIAISGDPDPQHLGMLLGIEILAPALFFERYKPQ